MRIADGQYQPAPEKSKDIAISQLIPGHHENPALLAKKFSQIFNGQLKKIGGWMRWVL